MGSAQQNRDSLERIGRSSLISSTKIPWLRVFVEGMVIVSSILLAFGIDRWWEGRQDRGFEQEALRRLSVEFAENRDRLGEMRTPEQTAPRLAALHEILQSMPGDTESVAIPDTLLAALLGTGTFDRITPVLDGLLRSGRYELIRDPQVRETIATWERWHAQLVEREEFQRAFVDTRLSPALATRGDMSRIFRSPGRAGISARSDRTTVLFVDNELKALVAERLGRNELTIQLRSRLRASTDDVLSAIARGQGG